MKTSMLGTVHSGWQVIPLGLLADLESGGTPTTSVPEYWAEEGTDGAIPWVAISDMSQRDAVSSTNKHVTQAGAAAANLAVGDPGTLLFSIYASVGEVARLSVRGTWNQAILGVRPNDSLIPSYLFYVLRAAKPHLRVEFRSNTQDNLSAGQVARFRFPVPPIPTQRRIADYLDRETGEIDAMLAKLDEMTEALESRMEAVASSALLPLGIAGDPTDYRAMVALGYSHVARIDAAVERRRKPNEDQNAQYLSLLKGRGVLRYEDKGSIGNKKPQDLTRAMCVKKDDFLINSMNFNIGSFGISPYDGVCSSVYLVFTPVEGVLAPSYLKHLFANSEFRQRVQDLGNGILEHRKSISWDKFAAVKIPSHPSLSSAELPIISMK